MLRAIFDLKNNFAEVEAEGNFTEITSELIILVHSLLTKISQKHNCSLDSLIKRLSKILVEEDIGKYYKERSGNDVWC